jgi:hypothetical protein
VQSVQITEAVLWWLPGGGWLQVLNVARMARCAQEYAEQKEEALAAAVAELGRRVAALEANPDAESQLQALEDRVAARQEQTMRVRHMIRSGVAWAVAAFAAR